MKIYHQLSSASYNSFGIASQLETLVEIEDKTDLYYLRDELSSGDCKVLGGGSNILLTGDVSGKTIHLNNKGIEIIKEAESYVLVKFSAGENWHEAVLWAVSQGFGGIENLSLIPGKCGAAPLQNIGAYGVEIKDVLHSVFAFKKADGLEYIFHNSECAFGYRTSNFKTIWKDQFIITDIILKLTKPGHHKLNLSYGAIGSTIEKENISEPTISEVSRVVISIRESKLPDPTRIGNAGSFFKNPIVQLEQFEKLITNDPKMPSYPVNAELIKIPAAWLIDQCGWKGKIVGQTGTYKNQALVLVNHGGATGQEIYKLSTDILESVKTKFGVELEREVNVW